MAYAVKQFTVTDNQGNILANADVDVVLEGGGASPIFEDRDGNTPLAVPFQTDANGFAQFFAPGGAYKITVTKDGTEIVHRYVAIGTAAERDADEFGQLEAGMRWREMINVDGQDLDQLLVAGFYKGSGLSNAPGGSSDGFYITVFTNQGASADAMQLAYHEAASPVMWLRARLSTGWGSWVSFPVTAAANAWTAQQYFPIATLTDAATISWDVAAAQVAKVTLTTNRTLGNPTNAVEGGIYVLVVINGGSDTLSFGSAYEWPNDNAPDTGNDAAGERSVLTFVYENSKMRGVAALKYPA